MLVDAELQLFCEELGMRWCYIATSSVGNFESHAGKYGAERHQALYKYNLCESVVIEGVYQYADVRAVEARKSEV